jgi:hypothetical protein
MLVIYLLQSFFRCTIQFKFHDVDELSFFCDEVNANEFHVEVKKNGNEVVCRSKVIFE